MRYHNITLILIFFFFLSVSSNAQAGKSLSLIELSGVQKQGDIYKIMGIVNLKGKTLVMPKGATIDFLGGKITNGNLLFNENQLLGDIQIECSFEGSISNDEIKTSWFGLKTGSKEDQTTIFQSIINLYQANVSHNSWDINLLNPEPTIVIPSGRYNIGKVQLRSYITIKGSGRGSTELHGASFCADNQYNIIIEDLSIVGHLGGAKNSNYSLDQTPHSSAFLFKDCARLVFKNVCIKNYDVAFDNYNTYLVDLYSCFISYCNVCYMNDGKGNGYGGHAVRWYGGEMCESKYGFVQKNGNGVLLNGATIEGCKYAVNCIYPVSLTISSCYFEKNNYDIYGTIIHVNIDNNFFSESGKKVGDAYIYATTAIGFTIIQGNKFGNPILGKPHIIVNDDTRIYSNIMIGQNDIVHGGRIPVSEQLQPYVMEKGVNTYQTYLPNGKNMLMGQTIVYKNPNTGKYYLVTRDMEGKLLYAPFSYIEN